MKTNVSWRILKANLEGEYILKTSSEDEDERRLQDIFKMSSLRRIFAGLDLSIQNLSNLTFRNKMLFDWRLMLSKIVIILKG